MEHNSLSDIRVNAIFQPFSCSPSTEILGAIVKNGDWPYVVDAKACLYGGLMASLLSTSLGVHHMREGVMIWELIDKMGGNKNPNVPSLNFSISQKLGHPMEKILDHKVSMH